MNEQRINELLSLADAGSAAPGGLSPDLAGQAIRRARRRSTIKRVGLSVLVADAVASLVIVSIWLSPAGTTETAGPDFTTAVPVILDADPDMELAELHAQVSTQEAVVEALLAAGERPGKPLPVTPDPLDEIRAQAELAAKRMVLTADRIERERGRNDLTNSLYADVLHNFPDSDWAGIARRRVDEYEHLTEPRSAL